MIRMKTTTTTTTKRSPGHQTRKLVSVRRDQNDVTVFGGIAVMPQNCGTATTIWSARRPVASNAAHRSTRSFLASAASSNNTRHLKWKHSYATCRAVCPWPNI